MNFQFATLAVLIASLASPSAFAAKKKKPVQPPAPTYTTVTIEVPQNKLQVEAEKTKVEHQEWFTLGVSSWAPNRLSLPSRLDGASGFKMIGAPGIYANILTNVFTPDLALKLGANWVGLRRSGTLSNTANIATAQTQDLNLFSARLGVEYAPLFFTTRVFSPYISGALLPTFAISSSSAFDDGANYFGVPVEAAIGTRVSLGMINLRGVDLDLNVNGVVGTIKSSSVAGYGFAAGIRVIL